MTTPHVAIPLLWAVKFRCHRLCQIKKDIPKVTEEAKNDKNPPGPNGFQNAWGVEVNRLNPSLPYFKLRKKKRIRANVRTTVWITSVRIQVGRPPKKVYTTIIINPK